jgi:hypothetical protein
MPALKPWYKVVSPREDLREGKPLDASEFAVHLDQVRDGRAPTDYQKPDRFFDRTYLTQNLLAFAAEVVRRLSGTKTETSSVFNLNTQFGGGKTHFLTLLYHLAIQGPKAERCNGVSRIVERSGVAKLPQAATAVFVGQKFDVLTGRGGDDGTPKRLTPWGEIAFQLSGPAGFDLVSKHDEQRIAPGGDVIAKFLPANKPSLILIDELLNYVSSGRKLGLAAQSYNFLQNLSEEVRGRDNVVLAVSIPASELEMNADDVSDFQRLDKLLDRLGKPVMMSAEAEASEIIRRRLFEWDGALDKDAQKTVSAYAEWVVDHRQQVPSWFPVDQARDVFAAAYPFHPNTLSVFERKWQGLPRFQQTRGMLRLLALWVSRAYVEGFKGGHRDALIGLGTAPLDDSQFRSATFEQLGESKLEGAVTTDIAGKKEAHAIRLDKEAEEAIRKARLHRKVATVIFFESNGGQAKAEATVPEIRLAVAEPELDVANVDGVLEGLSSASYYLTSERHRYRFSISPNLNKLLADRRANIQPEKIEERVKAEVQKVFSQGAGVERVFFPEKSNQVPDRPVLTFVVLTPEQAMEDEKKTKQFVEAVTREYGASSRTFKSALVWCVADGSGALHDEARKLLAWEDIQDEEDQLRLDESHKRQLAEHVKKAQRDLRECVWRTYKHLLLLGKDNALQHKDLGLVHSSSANDLVSLLIKRLRDDGDVESAVSPTFLVRHWPALKEWSTKAVRDAFFASPLFPRLLNGDSVKETVARGVENGILAYVGKGKGGRYAPFHFGTSVRADEVEISDEMYLITAEEAKKCIEPPRLAAVVVTPEHCTVEPGKKQTFSTKGFDQHGVAIDTGNVTWNATGGTIDKNGVFAAGPDEGNFLVTAGVGSIKGTAQVSVAKPGAIPPPIVKPPIKSVTALSWEGDIPPQKWMNFYTKVLSKFAAGKALNLTVRFELSSDEAITPQKIEETKTALRELGLEDDLRTE